MMKIDINHWLNLKWLYMSMGEKPMAIFKGYINAVIQQAYQDLNLSDNESIH